MTPWLSRIGAFVIGLALLLTPFTAQAESNIPPDCRPADPPDNALIVWPTFSEPSCQRFDVITGFAKDIVDVLLMLVLSVALIFLILAGYQFATAAGNKQALTNAKQSLFYIILGIMVVLSAYMVVTFLGGQFLKPLP